MIAHTTEQFDLFMSQLQDTNATLSFYSDFPKISKNVANIAISLNMLNFLIGKRDLRDAVEILWERDPKVFQVLDIVIATRKKEKKKFWDNTGNLRLIHSLFDSVDGVMDFLEGTGFAKIIQNTEIKDFVDYVFGVETGLDSHGRKNRSGEITEGLVSNMLLKAGISFQSQVSVKLFPAVAKTLGEDNKVFDFVIRIVNKTYFVEVNFYSSGGSKLNEVARSYTEIAQKVNGVNGCEFVWITDGKGWKRAKNKLQEAFAAIPNIYNLTTTNVFINQLKSEGVINDSLF